MESRQRLYQIVILVRFTSNFWQALWKMMGTGLSMSTSYHPQTDGQTERANRVLEEMLRSYVNDHMTDWDECLVAAEVAVNSSQHSSTGYSSLLSEPWSGRSTSD